MAETVRESVPSAETNRQKASSSKDEPTPLAPIIPVPPDGGWGWVIVGVCSFGNLSIDTVPITFPTLHIHLAEHLDRSLTEISLIISMYNLFCYISGPFSGAVANRIGFRLTMCVGAVMGFVGLGVCYFVYDYIIHLIFIGVFAGIGGSFVYMTSMAAPGFWFEEKRALAAGISSCSSGFAAVVVPIIAASIEKNFGWHHAMIIPAGLYFILSLLSLLIRTAPAFYLLNAQKKKFTRPNLENVPAAFSKSILALGGPSQRKILKIRNDIGLADEEVAGMPPALLEPSKRRCRCCKGPKVIERPMYKKDVFYHGSVSRIRDRHTMLPGEYTISVARVPTLKDVREEVEGKCTLCTEAFKRGIKTLFDFTVFTNKSFLSVLFSSFFFYNGIYIPFIFLKRVGIDNEINENYANLLTPLFGIGVTLARSTVGIVMMVFPRIGSLNITVVSLCLSTLMSFLLCLYFHIVYQFVLDVILGYSAGLFLPLRSVILIDFVGLEKLTSAMGFIFTVQGIGSFSGIPLAEILMEHFDDSRCSLIFSGIAFFISMIFLLPIYFIPMAHNAIHTETLSEHKKVDL